MIRIKIILFIILITTLNLNAQSIKLMTEIFPPFQYKYNDKVIGISTDIVKAIQRELKVENEIQVYPWTEALTLVSNQKNTAIFSMLRTPDREDKYKWVGPLTSMKLVFFKKKDSPIILNDIEDAKKVKKVGVTKGVANFEMLKLQGFENLEVLKDGEDEQNIQKLMDGSIDLWPTLLMAGLYNAQLQGLAGEVVPIKDVVAFSGDMYIAFNINTEDEVIQRWQKALDKIKNANMIEEISGRYQKEDTNYVIFIKIFIGVFIIMAGGFYYTRQLSRKNHQLHELQEELRESANRDYMTNLYNRRYFYDIADNIIMIGRRDKKTIGIIMIDIDNFKKVNDIYGHAVGDIVIKKLASIMIEHTRESDIVARFGGEEFAILLPSTDADGSYVIASKLKEIVEKEIVTIDAKTLSFTISLGVTTVLVEDENIEDSLDRADKALYKAKENGKNKVVLKI